VEKQHREEVKKALIPSKYRVDNLFLLVGTNPLPNLVAAKLLLKAGGTLYLVHSADTSSAALRLETVLAKRYGIRQCQKVEVHEAEAHDVESKINAQTHNLKGSVGLHYTGGTKTMSVHTYRTVEAALSKADSLPVFSYLDANSFELRIDPAWREKVLLEVKPTLDDLLALHGISLKSGLPNKSIVVLSATAVALAQAAPADGLQAWRHWCENVLCKQAHTGKGWRKKSELRDINLALPDAPVLQEAIMSLKSELDLASDTVELPLGPSRSRWPFHKNEPKYMCQWLDGTWLEYYVLSQIQAVSEDCQLHDWGMTLATDVESSLFEFEFDLAAMRGYQLFGISCTTDLTKSTCKFKLFEAYIRSRQLGGDEARVGLVCGYHDPEKLQGEVTYSWDAEGKIRLFGPQDLPDLSVRLAQWFKTAS
jgi:hypothetical protein